jgi:hypothetical protein
MAGITAHLERRCGAWNVRAVFILAPPGKLSNSKCGEISPKVMAMIIRNALTPLVAMLVSRAAGAIEPIETDSTRPVAASKRLKPGSCRYPIDYLS